MPEDMPGRMPEDMPDRMPEDMSDRMPEDLPVTKCIHVMVGITRSKVILVVLASSDNTSCHICPGFALFQTSTRPPEPTRLTIRRSHSSIRSNFTKHQGGDGTNAFIATFRNTTKHFYKTHKEAWLGLCSIL